MPVLTAKNPGDPWDAIDNNNLMTALTNEHQNSDNNEHNPIITLGQNTTTTDRGIKANLLSGPLTLQYTAANSRWEANNGSGLQAIMLGGSSTIPTASTTTQGILKISTVPTVVANPVAVETGDPRVVNALPADPASPATGQVWVRTDLNALRLNTAIGVLSGVNLLNDNTANSTAISNTGAGTATLFSTSVSIPANTIAVGKGFRWTGWGSYSTTATPTMIFRFSYNGVNLVASAAMPTANNASALAWRVHVEVIWRAVGVSGSAVSNIATTVSTGAATVATDLSRAGATTVATNAVATAGLSWECSVASVSNQATLEGQFVETLQ